MARLLWHLLLALVLLTALTKAQDEAAAEGEAEAPAEGEAAEAAEEAAESEDAEAAAEEAVEEDAGEEEGGDEVVEEEVVAEEASETGAAPEEEDAEADADGEEEALDEDEDEAEADAEAESEEGGAAALAKELFQCDMDGMDEKLAGCMEGLDSRMSNVEQAVMSGEGGGLEEQITLVLVKKGVIDCDNDTQCADDRACISSYSEPGRLMCERPCDRHRCDVPYSKCVAKDHKAMCVCKDEFHGNGTVACHPKGFEEQNNTRSYRMFDDLYVTYDNASQHCQELGARLPVLDSEETIDIVKSYLENANFSVFLEPWDRSSRRVWIGLVFDRASGLIWADGQRVIAYPESSRLFVWESRRILSQEVTYADNSRHYALYIDGDVGKLPGGGRKGAAVLCELDPRQMQEPYDPYSDPRYSQGYGQQSQGYPNYQYPSGDAGYPNYPRGEYR